jgi:hypothetical protein
VEAFHSTIKDIHIALEMKASFDNSMPTTGYSTESSTMKSGLPTDPVNGLVGKEKRRNLHTKSYKAKLERLRSARLTRRDQAVRFLDMQRLQVINDT